MAVTLRTRKLLRNDLLKRKQMVRPHRGLECYFPSCSIPRFGTQSLGRESWLAGFPWRKVEAQLCCETFARA